MTLNIRYHRWHRKNTHKKYQEFISISDFEGYKKFAIIHYNKVVCCLLPYHHLILVKWCNNDKKVMIRLTWPIYPQWSGECWVSGVDCNLSPGTFTILPSREEIELEVLLTRVSAWLSRLITLKGLQDVSLPQCWPVPGVCKWLRRRPQWHISTFSPRDLPWPGRPDHPLPGDSLMTHNDNRSRYKTSPASLSRIKHSVPPPAVGKGHKITKCGISTLELPKTDIFCQ